MPFLKFFLSPSPRYTAEGAVYSKGPELCCLEISASQMFCPRVRRISYLARGNTRAVCGGVWGPLAGAPGLWTHASSGPGRCPAGSRSPWFC